MMKKTIKSNCKYCNIKISLRTVLYGNGTCKKCSRKTLNYCCMDCGDYIYRKIALNGGGRCKKCRLIFWKSLRKSYFCPECSKEITYMRARYKHTCKECTKNKRDSIRITINYCCKDCGGLIGYNSANYGKGFCHNCSHKLHNNKKTLGMRWIMSKAGKKNIPRGKEHQWYKDGRCKRKVKCVDCGKSILFSSKRCRNCSLIHDKPHRLKYNKIKFRSSWEANFAKWCNLSGYKYEYEQKFFSVENRKYLPDFYLPEFDCYIEIKGYWYPKALSKFNKFLSIYKNTNILLLDKNKLIELGVIYEKFHI